MFAKRGLLFLFHGFLQLDHLNPRVDNGTNSMLLIFPGWPSVVKYKVVADSGAHANVFQLAVFGYHDLLQTVPTSQRNGSKSLVYPTFVDCLGKPLDKHR